MSKYSVFLNQTVLLYEISPAYFCSLLIYGYAHLCCHQFCLGDSTIKKLDLIGMAFIGLSFKTLVLYFLTRISKFLQTFDSCKRKGASDCRQPFFVV